MSSHPPESPLPQTPSSSHMSLLVNRDEEHLRLLGLYHFVAAAVQAVILVLFVIVPLLSGPAYYRAQGMAVPANSEVFQQVLLLNLILRTLFTAMLAMNGWWVRQKKYWWTCVMLSVLECSGLVLLRDTLGMMLGLSAIWVLRRESVKEVFRMGRGPKPHQRG